MTVGFGRGAAKVVAKSGSARVGVGCEFEMLVSMSNPAAMEGIEMLEGG